MKYYILRININSHFVEINNSNKVVLSYNMIDSMLFNDFYDVVKFKNELLENYDMNFRLIVI